MAGGLRELRARPLEVYRRRAAAAELVVRRWFAGSPYARRLAAILRFGEELVRRGYRRGDVIPAVMVEGLERRARGAAGLLRRWGFVEPCGFTWEGRWRPVEYRLLVDPLELPLAVSEEAIRRGPAIAPLPVELW